MSFIKSNPSHQVLKLKSFLGVNPIPSLIGFVILLVVGSLALTAPANYDSGLYHFQSIRWLNEFPVVLGLGNVHGRLGFNQAYFSFVGLLNFFPFFNRGYALGGLLMLVISAATLMEARLKDIRGGWWLNIWIFVAFIGVSNTASPSPDIAVTLVESCIFIFLLQIYSRKFQTVDDVASNVAMVLLLSCLVVTP
ncbi:LIC_10190 family membrane protein [Polynucleobacter necessarius]|uniref:LIC_10190 family membrane protein n=1 Tax=Polynucleobacter necessarius TaxID=576610 RepID=UPI000FE1FDA3|nr:hypothetical protein [Polynucleobacter necessarius]